MHSIIRTLAFLRKEIFEVLRQPRLIFTLVLGPFLILFIFGIGYRNQARALRTLFVAEKGSTLSQQIPQYASSLGPQLIYMGVTDNLNGALDRLRNGEVDLVAVAPNNAYQTIKSNQQAVFTLYHEEIDPVQADYIKYFGQVYVDEVNRRVLTSITQQGQTDASRLQGDIKTARSSSAALRTAIQNGDQAGVQQNSLSLTNNVNAITLAAGASLGLLNGVQQTMGPANDIPSTGQSTNTLSDLRQNTNQLNSGGSPDQQLARLTQIENDLTTLDSQLSEFRSIDPSIIVSPFRVETKSIATIQPDPTDFYAPAVLALLLQHMAVTFAALSIVREKNVGTMELFRVSPLSAGETLIGKYLSYMIFGGIVAAILSALLVFVLHVPMFGDWINFALVVAVVLFASLGFGFVISILSQTDSQAVQYSMILLLASVFFSGFLMALDLLWAPVRVISWILPTTYGTILLRNIALRGATPEWYLLGALAGIGVLLYTLAWFLLRRMIAPERS